MGILIQCIIHCDLAASNVLVFATSTLLDTVARQGHRLWPLQPLSLCPIRARTHGLQSLHGEEQSAGRGLLTWTRGRPTATGIGSFSHPYHITRSYCLLVCPTNTQSLVLVTAISRMRAGPMVRATFWSSKLFTPHTCTRVDACTGSVL